MSDSTPVGERTEAGVLETADGARIAYCRTPGRAPGIVFLGGFASDMTGTKACALEAFARSRGQAMLRFDYQGHGRSSGQFLDGSIGLWRADALAVIDALSEGPQVLVGSSMGGWIMLLAAVARPHRLAGLVGIAAAPDFTEDLMWARFDETVREILRTDGVTYEPSEYSEEPYAISYNLIVEGRNHLLLRRPIAIRAPVRLLHGMADTAVPFALSVRLAERLDSEDVRVHLVKGGDHRLSSEADLALLCETVAGLLEPPQ